MSELGKEETHAHAHFLCAQFVFRGGEEGSLKRKHLVQNRFSLFGI